MRAVGVGSPEFLAVDHPAVAVTPRARLDRREVGARAGFAHADAEIAFAPADRGQVPVLLPFGTVAKYQRAALPVGEPVRRYRCTGGQQFLDYHVTREGPRIRSA